MIQLRIFFIYLLTIDELLSLFLDFYLFFSTTLKYVQMMISLLDRVCITYVHLPLSITFSDHHHIFK